MKNTLHLHRAAVMACVACAVSSAHALGSISANYSIIGGIGNPNFTYAGNAYSPGGGMAYGVRTGGTDTTVPANFFAVCVEVGEPLNVPANNTHPNVVPLIGSSTNGGGITGPVLFGSARTKALQKLWGSYFGAASGGGAPAYAFQLAQWEITFDNALDLTTLPGPGNMFVSGGQFQAGITDVAETWLTAIRNDVSDAMPQTPLLLLTGPGVQDLVTPVPEPATLIAVAAGLGAVLRRRRK